MSSVGLYHVFGCECEIYKLKRLLVLQRPWEAGEKHQNKTNKQQQKKTGRNLDSEIINFYLKVYHVCYVAEVIVWYQGSILYVF